MPPTKKAPQRTELIRAITTPLGFYVLSLLIIEATMALVLTASKLDAEHVWSGFLWMISLFVGVVGIVTLLACLSPTKLLYGKEEHANPALEPSALRDSVEELIISNVKPEALKKPNLLTE